MTTQSTRVQAEAAIFAYLVEAFKVEYAYYPELKEKQFLKGQANKQAEAITLTTQLVPYYKVI